MSDGSIRGARRLVVNGDDFGLAAPVDEGIALACERGILTSTSLMVAGDSAADAVRIARALPRLAVGLHLTLVQGRAILTAAASDGLTGADGRFRNQPVLAGLAYWFSPRLRAAVAREVRAQLEAFRATGLTLSHVDGHLNVHLHPLVRRILLQLAAEFEVRAVRLTREPLLRNLRFDARHAPRKAVERVVFAILSELARRSFVRSPGRPVVFVDSVFGMHQSGACDETYVRHVLETLPPGAHELYCHPATHQTEGMRRAMPGYRPRAELEALIAPAVRELVVRREVELVSYAALATDAAAAPAPGLTSAAERRDRA